MRFVLEGEVGALLAGGVPIGGPGDLIVKPRNQWHTFSNAGGSPARILEMISPAGFEGFFRAHVDLGRMFKASPAALASLCDRYGYEMRPDSIPGLIELFARADPASPSCGRRPEAISAAGRIR